MVARVIILFFCSLGVLWAQEQDLSLMKIQRYALIVGANDGGAGRTVLQYAQSDARAVAQVLKNLGGLETRNQILLSEPSAQGILAQLDQLKRKLAYQDGNSMLRKELFFYYSGHSDENGLLLQGEHLTYKQLKDALNSVNADVRVAVLDSCASGAFTRLKGGKKRQAFLMDESSKVKGYAFLTSSSADEAAQESDAIGGSYFTHYFVSALRGAADVSNDKKVTLNEAYQYAFHETLARTENSLSGPQHAAYDFQLSGAGELVLTDLRRTNATLVLPKEMDGKVFIRDLAGRLVVEMRKQPARVVSLGLEPKKYVVSVDSDTGLMRKRVQISNGSVVFLDMASFETIVKEQTVARGDIEAKPVVAWPHKTVDSRMSVTPELTWDRGVQGDGLEQIGTHINLFMGKVYRVRGIDAGLFVNRVEQDMIGGQGVGLINHVQGNVDGGQGAGIGNVVGGDVQGGQGAGVFNVVFGNLRGGQGAGVFNLVRGDAHAGQAAGVFNVVEGSMLGGQAAGQFNIVRGNLTGGQSAGLFNIVEHNVRGAQVSGVFNLAKGKIVGAQVAGLFNMSFGEIKGAQVSGLFNIARDEVAGAQVAGFFNSSQYRHKGTQVGLVNYAADVKGTQVGLLNIADKMTGMPVGIINIIGNGRTNVDFTYDNRDFASIDLKSGTRHFYSVLQWSHGGGEKTQLGYGMGLHLFDQDYFRLDFDVLGSAQWNFDHITCAECVVRNPKLSARLGVALPLTKRFALNTVFALNAQYRNHPELENTPHYVKTHTVKVTDNNNTERTYAIKLWPSVNIGFQF
ncbi:MAG: caspase family protein [Gammaproteobacteria bacterium]|nr:caspase family protein [Gammaproteobacteria bacterium]MDH5727823.1 caspase family protein [Gammaproteobacteria bacterium]